MANSHLQCRRHPHILPFKRPRQVRSMGKRLPQPFYLRSDGDARYFLGMRIIRDREQRKIWLLQDTYIAKLGEKYNITVGSKPPKTPIPPNLQPHEGKDLIII